MFSKRTAAVLVTVIVLVGIFGMKRPEYPWLLWNHERAEALSFELLSGAARTTPEWAIDLVVVSENGIVIYSPHDAEWVVAFSPSVTPKWEGLEWEHVWKQWYVARMRT